MPGSWLVPLIGLVLSPVVGAAEPQFILQQTARSLPQTGDPIWLLSLQVNNQTVVQFDRVSGRAHRQDANRHQGGSLAPLPPGTYIVGKVEPLGPIDLAELRPLWIGIEPTFATGRGHLGIHLYPSANRNANGGTLGGIRLINPDAIADLASLVGQRQARTLQVMN